MSSKNKVIRRQSPAVIEEAAEEGWEFVDEVPADRLEHMIRAYQAAGADEILYSPVEQKLLELPRLVPEFDFFFRGDIDYDLLEKKLYN